MNIYWKETKYEFLKMLRSPRFGLATLTMPLLFYILYAVVLYKSSRVGGAAIPSYMLATFGSFSVMGVCLFGIGLNLANERGLGWLEVKRASPLPPSTYFLAKLTIGVLFAAGEILALFALGLGLAHVQLKPLNALRMIGILAAGSIPFGALGIALGYFAKPDSAPVLVNLVYLPLAFFSGLWMPVEFLPKALQHAAVYLPPYHLSRLALGVLGADRDHTYWNHWQALACFTAIFLGLAMVGYRRDNARQNGLA
ncbi:MAG TPA: ABC transporter permease [Bryobacteraceae bacterium]|jgi:ABC-2 type transport system permease protein